MYMTVEGVKFRDWDGPKKYQHRYFKQLTIFLFTQMFVSSITPRIQRTWHMTGYPPPTRPDFEETLQSKEDSEGCACCLHHLLLVGRVASELWKYIVKVIVITINIYPETPPYCHDRHCLLAGLPWIRTRIFSWRTRGWTARSGWCSCSAARTCTCPSGGSTGHTHQVRVKW